MHRFYNFLHKRSFTMENTQERDAELYRAYRRFMNELNTSHREAVKAAVNSPASRYYVSPNYLYREILRRERSKQCNANTPSRYVKHSVYDKLYSDYLSMRDRPLSRGLSMEAICDLLVNRPAPSFFIGEKRGDEVIKSFRGRSKFLP